jgi:hypothetical protein
MLRLLHPFWGNFVWVNAGSFAAALIEKHVGYNGYNMSGSA